MNTWEWIQEHSTLVLLVAGGLLVGIFFLKKTPPQAATVPMSSADLSGLATDGSGHPIVYRDVADTFVTENISGSYNSATSAANAPASVGSTTVGSTSNVATQTSTTTTTDNHSTPIEHPIEPAPSHTMAYYGVLGANVQVDIPGFRYKNSAGQWQRLPFPSGTRLVQGSMNRVWFILPGANEQGLVTSGYGPPSARVTYPIGATVYEAAH